MKHKQILRLIDKIDVMGDKKQFKSILRSISKGIDENKKKYLKKKIDKLVVFTSTPDLLKIVLYNIVSPTLSNAEIK